MIAGNPISLTDGEQVRDFIFVDDVVDAFEVVINHIDNMFLRFYEFEVGSGVGTKIREFVEICHYLCKTNSVLYFGSLPSRQGEDMNCISDNTQLRSLEWYPRHNIESGVHKILSSLC